MATIADSTDKSAIADFAAWGCSITRRGTCRRSLAAGRSAAVSRSSRPRSTTPPTSPAWRTPVTRNTATTSAAISPRGRPRSSRTRTASASSTSSSPTTHPPPSRPRPSGHPRPSRSSSVAPSATRSNPYRPPVRLRRPADRAGTRTELPRRQRSPGLHHQRHPDHPGCRDQTGDPSGNPHGLLQTGASNRLWQLERLVRVPGEAGESDHAWG
jgi:hypothetical protein